jgi:hypothetical protein
LEHKLNIDEQEMKKKTFDIGPMKMQKKKNTEKKCVLNGVKLNVAFLLDYE